MRSPGFSVPPTVVSPNSDIQPPRPAHQVPPSRPVQHIQPHIQPRPHQRSLSQNPPNNNRHSFAGFSRQQAQMSPANFYPASFQKHYDQLGKSTPIPSFPQLPGSFVRPRLISCAQTRNMMPKSTCSTISTARRPIRTRSFRTFDFLPKPITPLWVCRPLHQRRRVSVATPAPIILVCRSRTIRSWMLIRLDSRLRCIFLTTLACPQDDRCLSDLHFSLLPLLLSVGVMVTPWDHCPPASPWMHIGRGKLFHIRPCKRCVLSSLSLSIQSSPAKACTRT